MSQAQQGNEQAYHQLLTEVSEAIAGYLRIRFGALEIMDDCVQESLIALHHARHTYDQSRPFRPWLFALVRHKAIDLLRTQNRHAAMLDRRVDAHESEALYTETGFEVGSVLEALKPTHREVLILTKVVGLSIAEAADKLEISKSAVKIRVHRAIKATRKILEVEHV